jgi:Putative MetA-pathway of phenol degradation
MDVCSRLRSNKLRLGTLRCSVKRPGLLTAGLLFLELSAASAQQLTPRAYAPAPVDTNVVSLPFTYQTGSVITDPSLPVQNVDAKVETATAFYERTFGFLGRSASAAVAVPYVWVKATGDVFEQARSITRSGQGDMVLRLASNILGGPALSRQEFARAPAETTLGASLVVSMPTGQYDGAKLVNIGTNRWSFKPEIGFSHPVARWTFDLYAGAYFFTNNDDFFNGHQRTQDPLVALQGHVIYTFWPGGTWFALDGTWYSGGQTTLDGVLNADRLSNTRFGATLAVPIGHRQTIKAAWAKGASVRFGQDFTTIGVTYQYLWF